MPTQPHTDAHYANQDRLPMWVLYLDPLDYPNRFVARMHFTLPTSTPTEFVILADSLASLRDLLPPGLTNIGRYADDDPKIIEVWL